MRQSRIVWLRHAVGFFVLLVCMNRGAIAARTSPSEGVLPVASYRLKVHLDEVTHIVRGSGHIVFRNPSPRPTKELYFHLYLNAFEDRNTLFLRDGGGRSGAHFDRPGHIRVLSLSSPRFGDTNLWEAADAHTPGDKEDRTDIRVELPEPVGGHETLLLDIRFESQLPRIVERTGFSQDFHLVAQWFPKLAKRTSDGNWIHFPFHPFAEFFADFGDYEVELDVPSEYVVGSTGSLTEVPNPDPGRSSYLAKATSVVDFAWTAWPKFHIEERDLAGVSVRLLSPASARRARRDAFETLERGIPYLGDAFFQYPYQNLTVVHPPSHGARAGGMEYPQFITTGGSETLQWLGVRAVQLVTVHELAHQWFQSIIASNEAAHPFLDEGLTTYAEWSFMEDQWGPCSLIDFPGICLSRVAYGRYSTLRGKNDQPVELPASEFKSFAQLSTLVYSRTGLSLMTLSGAFGREAFSKALADYALSFRFRHPKPDDFYSAIGRRMGKPAEIQLARMLREKGHLDLSLGQVHTRRTKNGYLSTISVRHEGNVWLPFFLQVGFEDGKTRQKRFARRKTSSEWTFLHSAPLTMVQIDPERRLLLDGNLLNNRRSFARKNHPRFTAKVAAVLSFMLTALAP